MLLARKDVKILSVVRDNNFFVVHGWMINNLGLKGTELELYAIIYGFSQTEGQKFHGNLQYLIDWTATSKSTVMRGLQSLVEKKLLVKNEFFTNGVKACEYRCNPAGGGVETTPGRCQNDTGGGAKLTPGRCQNDTGSGAKMTPNNISDTDTYKKLYKESDIEEKSTAEMPGGPPGVITPDPKPAKTSTRFIPPTLEEVRAYCQERGSTVNPDKFHAYYQSVNWYRGKTKIKDWKACVRTWESKEQPAAGQAQRQQLQPPPPRKGGNVFLDLLNEGV